MPVTDFLHENSKLIVGLTVGAVLAYKGIRCWRRRAAVCHDAEFVPIGTVKSLHVYPIKSGKGVDVFAFFCSPKGPVAGELRDRRFLVINGTTGRFYTARQKPELVLLEASIENNLLEIKAPNGKSTHVRLNDIRHINDVRKAYLHDNMRTDGFDCGSDVASFLSEYIKEPNTRLVMYEEGLFTERTCVPQASWWSNNKVPTRTDDTYYADLAPYMITTQASLDDLNGKLEKEVSNTNFRPVIVVDKCPAWDEDRWAELRIGDVELQCFKPCTRCVLTTVDPATGVKSGDMQPLKKLREFRLAPEGPMRAEFKDSPIFGVNAGVNSTGYIHVGQTVYARYKPTPF